MSWRSTPHDREQLIRWVGCSTPMIGAIIIILMNSWKTPPSKTKGFVSIIPNPSLSLHNEGLESSLYDMYVWYIYVSIYIGLYDIFLRMAAFQWAGNDTCTIRHSSLNTTLSGNFITKNFIRKTLLPEQFWVARECLVMQNTAAWDQNRCYSTWPKY